MLAILCLPLLILIVARIAYVAFAWRDETGAPPGRHAYLQRILQIAGIAILGGGVLASALVYTHTEPSLSDYDDIIGYDMGPDGARPITASESRTYQAKLQASGGNYDVLTDEVIRWLARRWHGRNLATTLLVLSAAAFLLLFYFARWF